MSSLFRPYLWMSLVVFPPLAILLNHDIFSLLLILSWTLAVVPLCIVQAIDWCRNGPDASSVWIRPIVKVFVGLFGGLSCFLGLSIVGWCLYNIVVRRLPEYSGPSDAVGLWLSGFGIAPALISFGWYLLRISINRNGDRKRRPKSHD